MIKIENKFNCTGCGACLNICPVGAISMIEDFEGFKYPVVDKEKCVNCNKCVNKCPVINFDIAKKDINTMISTHAYKSNSEMRRDSSSGGIFYDLAEAFIKKGGIVVGAAFDENFVLKHKIVKNIKDIYPLMGSKYLQSDAGLIYKEIKKHLDNNEEVLFFGLTCQIEGLLSVIENKTNLYCIDLICMGVPSPKVWNLYLDTFFLKNDIEKINFKDKKRGWHKFSFSILNKDGKEYSEEGFDNYYMQCMFKGYSLRPSCFKCKFKCENKSSDCTIADCWGCDIYLPEMDDNKGTSMIITHSTKGEKLLEILTTTGKVVAFNYDNVLLYNKHYHMCANLNGNRKRFFKNIFRKPNFYFKLYGKNPQKSYVAKIMRKLKI